MKALLCDIGGVLLNVHFENAIAGLSCETGLSTQEIEERIFSSGVKDSHDLGLISSREFHQKCFPYEEIPFESFLKLWPRIFTENLDMIDLLRSSAGQYRLYIASNTDPIHIEFCREQYQWFSMFEGYGLSYQLKALKPSPEFYERLCNEFGIEYGNAVFVDDLKENVETAARLGMKAHLFSNVSEFEKFIMSK